MLLAAVVVGMILASPQKPTEVLRLGTNAERHSNVQPARSSAKEEGPSPALFRDPPIEARPGAFWDWLNGSVNLAQLTHELEEMKAKGMSGAEIWDIGTYNQNPDETPIGPGPAFMGPESLKRSTMRSTRRPGWG